MHQIPINFLPKKFPSRSMEIMRLLRWINDSPQLRPHLADFTEAAFKAYYVDGEEISDKKFVTQLFTTIASSIPNMDKMNANLFTQEKLDALLNDEVLKDRLIQCTEGASSNGAFGVPYFEAGKLLPDGTIQNEYFFGSDRFHHIAEFLGLPYAWTVEPAKL